MLRITEIVWNLQFPGLQLQSPFKCFVKNLLSFDPEFTVIGGANEIINAFIISDPFGQFSHFGKGKFYLIGRNTKKSDFFSKNEMNLFNRLSLCSFAQ